MSKNVVAVVEKHIEKGILGLAAVFLGAMLWMYFLNSPNKVQFGSEKLGPAELNRAIEESARQLDSAIKSAKPADAKPEQFMSVLNQGFSNGIFAKPAPPALKPAGDATAAATPAAPPIAVRETLRTATSGGPAIVIPGEEVKKDAVAVNMIKPLAPLDVKASTGISLVVAKPRKLGEPAATVAAAAPGKDAKAPEPVELAWVSVGGYFDKRAQEAETAAAQYDASRRKFYLAGLDVERREVLASGEWSEWQLVEESKANPEFKIPKPIVKEDGSILNRKEIDEAWSIVKRAQPDLMQPPFAEVQAGDKWRMPHEEPEVPDDTGTVAPRAPKTPKQPSRGISSTPQPSGGSRGIGGSGGRGFGGGDGVVGGGIGRGLGGGAQSDPKARDEARKAAREDLDKAKKAMAEKDYPTAMSSAQQVVNNEHANPPQKRQAQGILDDAQAKMEAASAATAGAGPGRAIGLTGDGGGTVTLGGPGRGGFGGNQAIPSAAQATASPLITSEESGAPAVWFHDDTVKPGKTYQYRMRVRMWNRYLGQIRAVANQEDAKRAYLEGEWSAPTDPITVAPRTHFFVKGMKPDASGALVEVWTLRKGNWVKQNFEVNIGDVIGGKRMMEPLADEKPADGGNKKVAVDFATDAIVLDLRVAKKFPFRNAGKNQGFQWNDRESLVLTYLDPADGQVKERYQALDQYDAMRKLLLSKEKSDAS